MTVSYTGDVANGSSFGCFWKILGRWKGSVYKLIWRELIAYLILYFTINLCYRHGMDEAQRHTFEKLKVYCSKQIESIPMSFVLGFYVTLIVKRWWDQYWILPLPDSLALYISASIQGQDERGRILRRTIMRYTMLAFIITLQRISFRVKKRFPTLEHLVDAGLIMECEKKIFDMFENKTSVSKFWMPIIWASNLVNRARLEGRIQSDHLVQTILTELSDFRRRLGRVMVYDTVSVPLVYTQVVTLAVYTYFVAALIGRQWVHPSSEDRRNHIYPGYELDLYFPIFLSLQFIFYIGWLKVAETLINPFGEDDDDFELNWLIDRHIQVSYMVVDEMHEEHPELLKDHYWDQVVPSELPYNIASEQFRKNEPAGSTASMKIKENESVYDRLTSVKRHGSVVPDEVYADLVYSITGQESMADSPLVDKRKNWLQRQLSRVESFRSTSSSSSLFNRPRAPIPLNNGGANLHNGGHRRSLYDKIISRRSSKEISRIPPTRMNGSVKLGKDALMPLPHSRPRVPTPEVTKDTQINIMPVLPIEKSTSVHVNVAHAVPANPGVSNHYTVSNASNNPGNSIVHSVKPLITHLTPPTTSGHVTSAPPSYDLSSSTTNLMLSPIEENDSSPYSTSSTSRSSKSSSNYPSTTAIFGRKHSPPPLDELPPIPIEANCTPVIQVGLENGNQKLTNGLSYEHSNGIPHEVDGTDNNHNELDEEEDPYQTIAEVEEGKNKYALSILPREYHGGRRYSKEKRELMLQKLQGIICADKSSQASLPFTPAQPVKMKNDQNDKTGENVKLEKEIQSNGLVENAKLEIQSNGILESVTNGHFKANSLERGTNTEIDIHNNNAELRQMKKNPIDEKKDVEVQEPLANGTAENEAKVPAKGKKDCEVFV